MRRPRETWVEARQLRLYKHGGTALAFPESGRPSSCYPGVIRLGVGRRSLRKLILQRCPQNPHAVAQVRDQPQGRADPVVNQLRPDFMQNYPAELTSRFPRGSCITQQANTAKLRKNETFYAQVGQPGRQAPLQEPPTPVGWVVMAQQISIRTIARHLAVPHKNAFIPAQYSLGGYRVVKEMSSPVSTVCAWVLFVRKHLRVLRGWERASDRSHA
jgi:hypothetical protein